MPHGCVTAIIPAPRAQVFALLHDYSRRLKWDSLLQAAYLVEPWKEAQLHAVSVCRSRTLLGGIAVQTEYVAFNPPELAAVKMLNRPAFFASFAASIRHTDLADGSSQIEYKFTFTARPVWLRWMLHPLMGAIFRLETRKRLRALSRYIQISSTTSM